MIHFFVAVWNILKDSLIALPTWVHAHPWVLVVFVLVVGIVSGLMAFWHVIFAKHYR
jgi:type II secretory pathway component PulF